MRRVSQQPLRSASVRARNLGDVFLETVAAAIKRLPRVKMTPISPAYTCFLQEKKMRCGESCCCPWEYTVRLKLCSCRISAAVLLQRLLDWFTAILHVSSLFTASSYDAQHVDSVKMFTITKSTEVDVLGWKFVYF